jgi:hypothetical protein
MEQAAGVKRRLMNRPFSGDKLLRYRFIRRKKRTGGL